MADEVDLRCVDVATRNAVEIERAERAREREQIHRTLPEVVARDERAWHVHEVRAGGIDLSVRPGGERRVVDEVEIERELMCRVVERIGGNSVSAANSMQRQVDGNDDESLVREGVGDSNGIQPVAREAMLEDDDRPAAYWLRGASRARCVGYGSEHWDRNRLGRNRHRIETRQQFARRIESRRSAEPGRGEWRRRIRLGWTRAVVRNVQRSLVEIRVSRKLNRRALRRQRSSRQARVHDGNGSRCRDGRAREHVHRVARVLRRETERQHDVRRIEPQRLAGDLELRSRQFAEPVERCVGDGGARRERGLEIRIVCVGNGGCAGRCRDAIRQHDEITDIRRNGSRARHERLQRPKLHDRVADTRIGRKARTEVGAEHERLGKADHCFRRAVDDHLRQVDARCGQRVRIERAREARADHRISGKAIELIHARLQRHERIGGLDIQRAVSRAAEIDVRRIRKHTLQGLEECGRWSVLLRRCGAAWIAVTARRISRPDFSLAAAPATR